MSDPRTEEIRARLAAATPGPWEVEGQGPGPNSRHMGCGEVWTSNPDLFGGSIAMPAGDCYPRSGYSPGDDMTLIAHAPDDLAYLLGRIADQDCTIARQVSTIASWEETYPCDGGCSPESGPEEDCSRHGRSPADLWAGITAKAEQIETLTAERDRYQEWSNSLAYRVPEHFEDDIAQEAIVDRWVDALVAAVEAARAYVNEPPFDPGDPDARWRELRAALDALDGGEGEC